MKSHDQGKVGIDRTDSKMGLSVWVLFLGVLSAAFYSAVSCTSWLESSTGAVSRGLMDVPLSPALSRPEEQALGHLGLDKAAVTVQNQLQIRVHIYAQYEMCWKCPLLYVGEVHAEDNKTSVFNTQSAITITLTNTTSMHDVVCSASTLLEEHGHYSLDVYFNGDNSTKCTITLLNNPLDSNLPIYVALAVLFTLAVLSCIGRYFYRKYGGSLPYDLLIQDGSSVTAELGAPSTEQTDAPVPPPQPPKQRLQSLDTFRGLSLVIMLFVNYKGGKYWFFHHSAWNGITLADTVFPWFTFIMGTSIALAFSSMLRRGKSRKSMAWKVVRRSIILFLLGLLVSNSGSHGGVHLSSLRIPGVLQRLAVSYFAVAMMEVFFAKADDPHQEKWWSPVRDVIPFWAEWLISLVLLTVHLCLTLLLPVPGCPTGYLGPGGIESNSSNANCTGGASGYIDRQVFGESHIYGHPTCTVLYQTTVPYDPEGLLGTLTSIFMCFLGLQAGKVLLYFPTWQGRMKRWLVWAVVLGLIAGILCKFSQNDGWIPVNKNFWSASFVLALASMAYVLLTVLYLLVDVLKIWGGAPFIFPGMNSIVVYLLSEILQNYFPVQFAVSATHASLLPMHMYGAAVWTVMAAVMYYKGVFIAI